MLVLIYYNLMLNQILQLKPYLDQITTKFKDGIKLEFKILIMKIILLDMEKWA